MKKIPVNKARQGRWGIPVLFVLVIGLALVGVVWIALEFFGAAIGTDSQRQPGAVQGLPAEQPDAEPDTIPGPTQ